MEITCLSILLLLLCWMMYEDFRYRAISLWTFPVLFIALALFSLQHLAFSELLVHLLANAGFLIIQLLFVALYFSIKLKRSVNFKEYIGAGDLLFFFALIPGFSPAAFFIFFTSSLLFALIFHLIFRDFRFYGGSDKIPLAGLQSLCCGIILPMVHFGLEDNLFQDFGGLSIEGNY